MSAKDWLKNILKGNGVPVIGLIDQFADGQGEEGLSAANLWNLIFQRASELRAMGLKPGQVLVGEISDLSGVIDCLSSLALDGTFWAIKNKEEWIEVSGVPADSVDSRFKMATPSGLTHATPKKPSVFIDANLRGLILATSGSPGFPGRPVLLTWEKVCAQVDMHARYWSEFDGSSRLSILPKHHCFGLILDFLVGLAQRQTVYLSFGAPHRSRRLLAWISENEIQIVALTPRQLWILCDQMARAGAAQIELTVHCGGAPIDEALMQRSRKLGIRVVDGYGLTEAGPGVLMNGKPIGCDVKLKALEASATQNLSELGELWVRSPTLGDFEGKLLDSDGFMATGDLAERVGDRLLIRGRIRDKLKRTDGTWAMREVAEAELKARFSVEQIYIVGPNRQGFEIYVLAMDQWSRSPDLKRFLAERYGIKGVLRVLKKDSELYNSALQQPGKGLRPNVDWDEGSGV